MYSAAAPPASSAALADALAAAMARPPDATAAGAGMDFGALVTSAVADTGQTLATAEQMTAAGAAGEAELIEVVTAVSAAEISLETVVAVRDEVVKAYQEILRMPI